METDEDSGSERPNTDRRRCWERVGAGLGNGIGKGGLELFVMSVLIEQPSQSCTVGCSLQQDRGL